MVYLVDHFADLMIYLQEKYGQFTGNAVEDVDKN